MAIGHLRWYKICVIDDGRPDALPLDFSAFKFDSSHLTPMTKKAAWNRFELHSNESSSLERRSLINSNEAQFYALLLNGNL